jgi:hypothetical protein
MGQPLLSQETIQSSFLQAQGHQEGLLHSSCKRKYDNQQLKWAESVHQVH